MRQEYLGAIDDADFPDVLAELRAAVPEADLPVVLAAAFGRNPDGTTVSGMQAFRLVEAMSAGGDHRPAAPSSEVSGSC